MAMMPSILDRFCLNGKVILVVGGNKGLVKRRNYKDEDIKSVFRRRRLLPIGKKIGWAPIGFSGVEQMVIMYVMSGSQSREGLGYS
jgi:hypothetical protein